MEETPREEVLRHHGFKEIALKFRKKWLDDDAVDCIKWVIMRISDDVLKFGYQYDKGALRWQTKSRNSRSASPTSAGASATATASSPSRS